jgi:glycerol-1-phosphate dehydrogenase [NAD(P)+]
VRRVHIELPEVVRIKPGALTRLGIYLARGRLTRAVVAHSEGMEPSILATARESLSRHGIDVSVVHDIPEASAECALDLFADLPKGNRAVIGLGGGKALDVAKYLASLADLPGITVPTSLSNDGFCSPQASLTLKGRRRPFRTGLPHAVIVDLDVCRRAPRPLWHSGIGDLTAKLTAVFDWKLAFHARGTPVNDLAALLSDATVHQLLANPTDDVEGMRLLATALMLNGVSMAIAGSSRPASGSEHLISHALDAVSARPALHGIQTGVAAYIVSRLQKGHHHARIADLFARTDFWSTARQHGFSIREWREAVQLAPTLRDDFHTILSERECWPEIEQMIRSDEALCSCFAE